MKYDLAWYKVLGYIDGKIERAQWESDLETLREVRDYMEHLATEENPHE